MEQRTNEQLVTLIRAGEDPAGNMLKLWEQNKGFIAKMARKYSGYAEMDDLMQEGYLGLNAAVEHYRPDQGTKFISYLPFWLKMRMQRYIENNSTVRLPSGLYDDVIKYKRIRQEYLTEYGAEPTELEIRALLGVSGKEFERIEENAKRGKIRSLSEPIGEEEDNYTLGDILRSGEDLETDAIRRRDHELMSAELWAQVERLPEKQILIIRKTFRDNCSSEMIGRDLGCSYQYINNMKLKAIRRLARPGINKGYKVYFEQYISANTIRHVGIESFQRTGYSEVERAVLGW